jgi:hypothetical protein
VLSQDLKEQIHQLPTKDKLELVKFILHQIQTESQPNAGSPISPQPRPFGLCAGEFTVSDDFDAPLPEDILSAFEDE